MMLAGSSPHEPHLIEPEWLDRGFGRRLPHFCCTAELTSFGPARDLERMCSGLVLVWFQEGFSPVIGDFIRTAVRQRRWADVAVDGDW